MFVTQHFSDAKLAERAPVGVIYDADPFEAEGPEKRAPFGVASYRWGSDTEVPEGDTTPIGTSAEKSARSLEERVVGWHYPPSSDEDIEEDAELKARGEPGWVYVTGPDEGRTLRCRDSFLCN